MDGFADEIAVGPGGDPVKVGMCVEVEIEGVGDVEVDPGREDGAGIED